MRRIWVLLLVFAPLWLLAQSAAPNDPPHREWKASWVTHPASSLREPLVLHFRRALDLPLLPASYVVRVSADNRFILYVNGRRAGDGPARGDLGHWRYERIDLAPYLRPGRNLLTATVWNFGVYAPVAQISDRTAFLLESEATGGPDASTPGGWQVEEEPGDALLGRDQVTFQTYFASGPGEEITASRYDWKWNSEQPGPNWTPAASPMRDSIFGGVNHAHSADATGDNPWGLIPDPLPPMEYSETPAGRIVRTTVVSGEPFPSAAERDPGPSPSSGFPEKPLHIAANSHIRLLLDRGTLTTAYPRLAVSGGAGSRITLTYAEALYDKQLHKGDRNAVGDRSALGLTDRFLPDGGQGRTFMPLWWRTWRYLDLDISTGPEPLTLESLQAWFTAYPFEQRASFDSGDPDLDRIWEISWRTARLDAHETYMDTPYYEQLQYVGDTRIQALISYSVAGDDRLGLQALEAFNDSRIPEGITRSRYPSSLPQNIPTFSLIWIGMLHDYWMYRPDRGMVRNSLPGMHDVLTWFAGYEQPDGLLRELPWWSFIDWVPSGQTPTYGANHESCVTTLEYLGALLDAADLEQDLGDPGISGGYKARADRVRKGIRELCWTPSRRLLADNPDRNVFSQQANILGVLYDVIAPDQQSDVLRRMLRIEPGTTPDGVLSASYYFRFYLARALDHADMAEEYLPSLDPWRRLLSSHFSTWPEIPGDTRSDSHAWSAHPLYDMMTLVAGVEPDTHGFGRVRIAPHLGPLDHLTATFPHPLGSIEMDYHRSGKGLRATIKLPGTLTGRFQFQGHSLDLKPGINQVSVQ